MRDASERAAVRAADTQIYSDALLTRAMANPTATDGMGNYSFYAAPGKYEIEINGPGIKTKQLPNVILPSDPSAPAFNSLPVGTYTRRPDAQRRRPMRT